MVATGKIEGYVHPGPTPFDIAAGCLIVEACGGRVTDMEGKPWTAFSKSIVATNGLIHEGVLQLLNNNEVMKCVEKFQ
jgi:myo-inositol-1(or 4)-monophosphatase